MRTATPRISRFNEFGTLPTPDGRLTFTSKSHKTTAEIQFAQVGQVWIAEYRFRFKCGGFHGHTLPLSIRSMGKASKTAAILDAIKRMRNEAKSRFGDEAMLNATQRNELAELRAWIKAQIEKQPKPQKQPKPPSRNRFFDVFAGIGGFHQAMASLGAICAGAVEIDPAARETYRANYGTGFQIFDDVCKVDAHALPDFEVLCGGFPCQSVSIAGDGEGYQAAGKTGLFFEIVRIAKAKRPKQIILENVPAFATHDGGLTCDKALDALAEIGYDTSLQVLDSSKFGVPQQRERLFIVGIRLDIAASGAAPFLFPQGTDDTKVVEDILEARITTGRCAAKMKRLLPNPTERAERPVQVGQINDRNAQGYRVYSPKGKGITLCAQSGGPGGQTGLYLISGKPRKLTPRECARMHGFPDSFQPHPSTFHARKQFGNSVAVPVVREIGRQLAAHLDQRT
jgi:DNA (cytosine-5)-methyltransferase 1